MKTLGLIASIICSTLLGCVEHAPAQSTTTNTTPTVASLAVPFSLDMLTNMPMATNVSQSTFGVNAGVLVKNGNLENFVAADCYVKTNWIFTGEIQNAPISSVVDSWNLAGGYRKAWQNADLSLQVAAQRNLSADAVNKPSWQGALEIKAAWQPLSGTRILTTLEFDLLTASHGSFFNSSPQTVLKAGMGLRF
jgi:hypothetical protein